VEDKGRWHRDTRNKKCERIKMKERENTGEIGFAIDLSRIVKDHSDLLLRSHPLLLPPLRPPSFCLNACFPSLSGLSLKKKKK
jgi:hypothetical protein